MCGGRLMSAWRAAPRSIAGANRGAHLDVAPGGGLQRVADFCERLFEIFVNVIAQRFERRHVNDPRFVAELSVEPQPEQGVERREECGERFAGTGRRGDQRVRSGLNRRPALRLRCGGRAELALEPLRDDRMKLELLHGPLHYKPSAIFGKGEGRTPLISVHLVNAPNLKRA